MKEIEDNTNKCKDISCSWIGRNSLTLIFLTMTPKGQAAKTKKQTNKKT